LSVAWRKAYEGKGTESLDGHNLSARSGRIKGKEHCRYGKVRWGDKAATRRKRAYLQTGWSGSTPGKDSSKTSKKGKTKSAPCYAERRG